MITVSPDANTELSLNKMPIKLYRHSELERLQIFSKYRKFILKD